MLVRIENAASLHPKLGLVFTGSIDGVGARKVDATYDGGSFLTSLPDLPVGLYDHCQVGDSKRDICKHDDYKNCHRSRCRKTRSWFWAASAPTTRSPPTRSSS